MHATTETARPTSAASRGVARWAGQMIGGLVLFGIILFLTAGRLDWLNGWLFLGLNALTQALSGWILPRRQGAMLADRSQVQSGTKSWDRFFAPAVILTGSLGLMLVAGLDARFGWSAPIPAAGWIPALVVAFAAQMFVLWAMATNAFFSTTVRIQGERGHRVVEDGPYRLVRHPGYAGSLVYTLACPLVLGSWWAFLPAILTVVLLFARTALEDRTLQAELAGYRDFTQKTRYRLIPGVW